jgi:hypothetical protein
MRVTIVAARKLARMAQGRSSETRGPWPGTVRCRPPKSEQRLLIPRFDDGNSDLLREGFDKALAHLRRQVPDLFP